MAIKIVDPRGVRFAGALTAVGAAGAAATNAWIVYAGFAIILLVGAAGGSRWNLWGWIYRGTLRRFLGPAEHGEPENPTRFAQLIGGAFFAGGAAVAALGFVFAAWGLAAIVGGLSLVNAATGFCLGCRFYWLVVPRVRRESSLT